MVKDSIAILCRGNSLKFIDKIPDVDEGDVVMFPSMTPHRAPKVENDIRKTIVSFNFNVLKIHENKLMEFKNA